MIFSSAGRVGSARFALVAVLAWVAWRGAVWALDRGGTITYPLVGAALGLVFAKVTAETARRLHDTGRSGRWGMVAAVMLMVPLIAILPTSLAYQPRSLFPTFAVLLLLIAAALLLRPGAKVANRYGEVPSGPLAYASASAESSARRSVRWAGVSALGCALLAYGAISISNGMREAHERDMRFEHERHAR